ncbi:hypothetical protein NC653_040451 [Populus alba x Populus x berolinensis]|uniref:Uncharacterized protein n=1 Tax=Populus alba x Populus x berolinensis TaxID=444605 RepID=A0AAD6L669_9ROSI|nr:hypothetical protein NC653_040451 [Populus alba x Populus x berolinensis]
MEDRFKNPNGVFDEFTSPVPLQGLFKALILDFGNLLPKLLPQLIKSVDFTKAMERLAASADQLSRCDGKPLFIEDTVCAGLPDGGSINKYEIRSPYHTKGDYCAYLKRRFKTGKETGHWKNVTKLWKSLYLLQNPEAYA